MIAVSIAEIDLPRFTLTPGLIPESYYLLTLKQSPWITMTVGTKEVAAVIFPAFFAPHCGHGESSMAQWRAGSGKILAVRPLAAQGGA